jgi:hypothetical protein
VASTKTGQTAEDLAAGLEAQHGEIEPESISGTLFPQLGRKRTPIRRTAQPSQSGGFSTGSESLPRSLSEAPPKGSNHQSSEQQPPQISGCYPRATINPAESNHQTARASGSSGLCSSEGVCVPSGPRAQESRPDGTHSPHPKTEKGPQITAADIETDVSGKQSLKASLRARLTEENGSLPLPKRLQNAGTFVRELWAMTGRTADEAYLNQVFALGPRPGAARRINASVKAQAADYEEKERTARKIRELRATGTTKAGIARQLACGSSFVDRVLKGAPSAPAAPPA